MTGAEVWRPRIKARTTLRMIDELSNDMNLALDMEESWDAMIAPIRSERDARCCTGIRTTGVQPIVRE